MVKKRWFISGVIGLCAVFIGSMFQTPWFSTFLLRHALGARHGIVVKTAVIHAQHFSLPGRFEFKDVHLVLKVQSKELTFESPSVDISGLQQWLGPDKRFLVDVLQAQVRYDRGAFKDVRVQFTVVPDGISGPLSVRECHWDKWLMEDVSGFMILNGAGVEMRALKFKAYDGNLTGKVMVQTRGTPITYNGEIFMEGFNVAGLGDVNPAISQQLDGVVTGTVSVEGDPVSLRTLDASLTMPSGGNISAALLAALTQYLPASREKKRLDALISAGGKLGMELFSFTLKGGKAGAFAGELHLRSREINLELNLTHEINTDGTIASLLAYWQKFVQ